MFKTATLLVLSIWSAAVTGLELGTSESTKLENKFPDLIVTEHNHHAERRLLKAFDGIVEKFDPEKDYGPGGFLGNVPQGEVAGGKAPKKHGRELLVPLAFVGLTQAVSSGLSLFSTLVGLFGRTYQEALVAAHLDNGYSKMRGHTHVFKGRGIHYSQVGAFSKYLCDMVGMTSKESRRGLEFQLRWAEYGDGDMWKENQFTFNVGKGGYVKTFTLYMNNDHRNSKLNIVTMTTDVKFKLAPDVFVILGMTSRFGGLMSSTRIRKVRKPQNIKEKHVTFTNDYFQLIGLQLLADLLEIGKAPPDPNFNGKYPRNLRDPRPRFDDTRREGNVPPPQYRLPARLEPRGAQPNNYPAAGGSGYNPMRYGGESGGNSPSYGTDNGKSKRASKSKKMKKSKSKKRKKGKKKKGKKKKRRQLRGKKNWRGVFPTTDRSHLHLECAYIACPSRQLCRRVYTDRNDCCGSCQGRMLFSRRSNTMNNVAYGGYNPMNDDGYGGY